ncbi:magnesium and cobalt transport protein CorA [Novosphingobium taihuense]|uniref:Magnesium transporter n=1 Tax=Novosphingobium taihuense TaxID=260085 RepID=A0A7W7ETB9_9SPHN|nr:magnesium and cobalt transport protein CorA [Novosphingobium taihuense]MBB4613097.1 magnesium transporter [Novosphingobium taihuense]TWH85240.1 magnesium transporter [Novosphingobium taihuense]
MTVIAARRYSNGTAHEDVFDLTGEPAPDLPPHTFDWIGLCEPDVAEMDLVRRQYCLHPLAVEDALNPRQLPKVEVYGKTLFVVARTAELQAGEEIGYGQTAFFVGPGFLISVRFGSTRAHLTLREELETQGDRLSEGPDYVLHAVLDFIVDGYLPLLEKLEEVAQEMEEAAIDVFPEQSVIRRIFRLRRQLRRFERVIGPMEEVCSRLVVADLPCIDPAARIWFRDVLDHVRRAMARMRGLKETLAAIVETASLLEQHRQGEMTRQLAAWAAILAVPTAIAGIYGMNFEYLPELKWHYGYFVVWGAIITICGGLWLRFRSIGWL